MVDNDRTAVIKIGGEEYRLHLNTMAVKQLAIRYGGMENIVDTLKQRLDPKDYAAAISELVWLIAMLANQDVMIHNLQHKDDRKDPLTEEMVELLSTPEELGTYHTAILAAIGGGARRDIISEASEKNIVAG